MSWVAVAIGGSAVLGLGGSLYASNQASKAGEVQAQAAQQGSQAQIQALLMAQGFQSENAQKAAAAITGALPNSLSAISGTAPGVTNTLSTARDQAATNLSPYIDTGNKATYTLASIYGLDGTGNGQGNALNAIRNSPDYQFAQTEGMHALESSNAAKGLLQSSEHLRSAQQFGQGLASQQFGNYVARLGALSSQGQSAANTLTGADLSTGNSLASYLASLGLNVSNLYSNQGNSLANVYTGQGNALAQLQGQIGGTANAGITGAGQANAAGIVGSANAINSGLTGVGNSVNSLMNYNLMSQLLAGRNGTAGGATGVPNWLATSNPGGYTPPTAPLGTGIWPA